MEIEDQVPGQVEDGVADATPVSQEGVTPAVTPVSPVTVADVDKVRAKYEQDINQLKSTLQKREAQVSAEWQKRYKELQDQFHQTRMATMTAEERENYERQLESEEMKSLQSRLAELENERQLAQSTVNAYSFFISQGVPADKLSISDGYDAVVANGWEYLTSELARLRQVAQNPQPVKSEPLPLKDAPPVITDKGTPASGTTWKALRDRFGTDEAVYRAVEEGRLDPSVIPQY